MSSKPQIDWDKQIKKLSRYAFEEGFEVIIKPAPKGISLICFGSKQILIHSNLNKERQCYTIIHELGHLVLYKHKRKKFNKTLGYQYEKFTKKSMVYKIAEIEEEIVAWRSGYKLAKKLKLKINRDNFELYKSSLITTYLVYALKAKNNSNKTISTTPEGISE